MNHKILNNNNLPKPVGPYSQGIQLNTTNKDIIYSSGNIGINPNTNSLVSDDFENQAIQVMTNLKDFLDINNSNFENVIKVTVFLNNMDNMLIFNKIYANYFKDNKPARSLVQVSKLPLNALVEVELIAYKLIN